MNDTPKATSEIKGSRKRLNYVNQRLEELKAEQEKLKIERTSLRTTLKANKQKADIAD